MTLSVLSVVWPNTYISPSAKLMVYAEHIYAAAIRKELILGLFTYLIIYIS